MCVLVFATFLYPHGGQKNVRSLEVGAKFGCKRPEMVAALNSDHLWEQQAFLAAGPIAHSQEVVWPNKHVSFQVLQMASNSPFFDPY